MDVATLQVGDANPDSPVRSVHPTTVRRGRSLHPSLIGLLEPPSMGD